MFQSAWFTSVYNNKKTKMSGKSEQILIIEPPMELSFRGPFTQPVTSSLKLKNPSDRPVCYKIKTTAPQQYCVKPNSGVIEPQDEMVVAVSLPPFIMILWWIRISTSSWYRAYLLRTENITRTNCGRRQILTIWWTLIKMCICASGS